MVVSLSCFLFSSRRRHTRGALVTGVQTCALPISATVHGTMEEFERYRATWDIEKHPFVVDGWAGDDARWFYTDERTTLGHYVEHCWFSDQLTNFMKIGRA